MGFYQWKVWRCKYGHGRNFIFKSASPFKV